MIWDGFDWQSALAGFIAGAAVMGIVGLLALRDISQ
jgi:hypothetical protein